MKVKELIQTLRTSDTGGNHHSVIQNEDSIHQAWVQFAKSKTDHLEVYENGVLVGTIQRHAVMEKIVEDYRKQNEKHYQVVKNLNYSLTKLKSLLKNVKMTSSPAGKDKLLQECEELINSTLTPPK